MLVEIATIIILILIFVVLVLASWQDIKHRTIEAKSVIYLYVLVPLYLIISGKDMTVASFCFMFTLVVFLCLWAISMKQFGIGDVIVIAALGWMLADFDILYAFLITMGVMSIPWGILWWFYYNRKNGYRDVIRSIKKPLPINDVRPGMVLSNDGFMHGLTQKKIDKMKDDGYVMVDVKQPFPFIPVVFVSCFVSLVFPSALLSIF